MTPDPWCPSARRHGTVQAYNSDRCRCAAARDDAARYAREWYARRGTAKVSSNGTRRRLEALGAAGWPAALVAARLGVCDEALRSFRIRDSILRSSADRVAAVYDELSTCPGPSDRARRLSRLKGWVPPSWWAGDLDDPAARPLDPWQRALDARGPLPRDLDALDDLRDPLEAALDAIEADDEEWFAARAASKSEAAA
jgi:hypothetical protein